MDYNKLSVSDLHKACKEKGIKGYSGKKKEDIVKLLLLGPSTPSTTAAPGPTAKDSNDIMAVHEFVSKNTDTRIVLLRYKVVIQWLFGDLSFLPEIISNTKKNEADQRKVLEDTWGQKMLKVRRPDLSLDKQWTNKFGEHLCEEIYYLLGKDVSKPIKKEHYQPDSETDDAILEAKAGTFNTAGTAGEKILGCPFKYAEIPELYNKPLKILCMGGAEKVCRESYGNLPGVKCSPQKKKFINFFLENKIEFIGATDILKSLIQ